MVGSTLSNSRRSGSSAASTRVVDIIIPVYSGLAEVRSCLESLLSSSSESQGEVIVINDCSPEPAIEALLRGLERESRYQQASVWPSSKSAASAPATAFASVRPFADVNWWSLALPRRRWHPPFSNNARSTSPRVKARTRRCWVSGETRQSVNVSRSRRRGRLPSGKSPRIVAKVGGTARQRSYEEVELSIFAADGWRHLLACDVLFIRGPSFGYDQSSR